MSSFNEIYSYFLLFLLLGKLYFRYCWWWYSLPDSHMIFDIVVQKKKKNTEYVIKIRIWNIACNVVFPYMVPFQLKVKIAWNFVVGYTEKRRRRRRKLFMYPLTQNSLEHSECVHQPAKIAKSKITTPSVDIWNAVNIFFI